MKGEDWPIIGYLDRFSVHPGETLDVMVSTVAERYTASVIRLDGDDPTIVDEIPPIERSGREQQTHTGSYAVVRESNLSRLSALTLHLWMYPTAPAQGRLQGLVAHLDAVRSLGWSLNLDGVGRLTFRLETDGEANEFVCGPALRERTWYEISCSLDAIAGAVRMRQRAVRPWPEAEAVFADTVKLGPQLPSPEVPLLIGAGGWADGHATNCYDGKLENPALFGAFLESEVLDRLGRGESARQVSSETLLAAWDFAIGIDSNAVTDCSGNDRSGTLINMPMRAATGHLWTGADQSFKSVPDQYAAIHFHSDDLVDAGWERDFTITAPAGLRSGAYAVRLCAGSGSDDVPFFVLPKAAQRAPIVVLLPTFTYLAYGNFHPERGEDIPRSPTPSDLILAKHPELGRGLYDHHSDGSGCCYASRLRPLVEFRPDHRKRPRHLPADLALLRWLERKGYSYDVITDEELHAEGLGAVEDYRVVITGSHPEYYSETMLDGLHAYVNAGGRLMYLGGNGFYWVTSTPPDASHVIEVRRGLSGTRTWTSEPGELYHSTTGELGGLWRHRGRAPNTLAGVGFAAMGGEGASGFARRAGSFLEEVEFIFEGVAVDEIIGYFGADESAAAGDEVDRLDYALGTPPNAILLASSHGLGPSYRIAIEDMGYITATVNATNNARARGDIVYHTRPNDGAVFAAGSIYWFRSLAQNDGDNNVSRITENVLRRFLA